MTEEIEVNRCTCPCHDNVMRAKEAAEYLKMSIQTFSAILKNDPTAIPHYTTGGFRLFSKKALDAFAEKPFVEGKTLELNTKRIDN